VRHRVVIADDAVGIRELIRTLLSLEPDFTVVGTAADGAEAVALVAKALPDLLVIDVSMPVMDGVEAITAVRKVSPSTRIAVLSGEHRKTPPGADAHIQKGTPNEMVVATLRSLCQRGPAGR
jgi:DNA-binding NarL/FixJ family response regulator